MLHITNIFFEFHSGLKLFNSLKCHHFLELINDIVCHYLFENPCSQLFSSIIGKHRDNTLCKDTPCIIVFINKMNGRTWKPNQHRKIKHWLLIKNQLQQCFTEKTCFRYFNRSKPCSRSNYCFVHFHAIESLASKSWKKWWMNVEYRSFVSSDQFHWYKFEVSS